MAHRSGDCRLGRRRAGGRGGDCRGDEFPRGRHGWRRMDGRRRSGGGNEPFGPAERPAPGPRRVVARREIRRADGRPMGSVALQRTTAGGLVRFPRPSGRNQLGNGGDVAGWNVDGARAFPSCRRCRRDECRLDGVVGTGGNVFQCAYGGRPADGACRFHERAGGHPAVRDARAVQRAGAGRHGMAERNHESVDVGDAASGAVESGTGHGSRKRLETRGRRRTPQFGRGAGFGRGRFDRRRGIQRWTRSP